MMPGFDRVSIPPSVLSQRVGDELVLLDINSGMYYGLNEVGARVWQLLSEGLDVTALVDVLADEYEASHDTLEADVKKLLEDLGAKGLIAGDAG